MSNFSAGTNFCSRSEMEIRSQFSLRVRSSQSGRRESQTKSISYFGCARATRHRRAVYFDGAANEFPPPPWDVAFRIGLDEYGGETLVSMRIEGLRAAEKA